jgi:hypothetical protein
MPRVTMLKATALSIRGAPSKPGPLSCAMFTLFLGATAIWAMPTTARGGQIFVTNNFGDTIGE